MAIYFAPMEGITDDIYRRVHAECFSGIDKYFIPFISPTQNLTLTARELRAVLPENNTGCHAVPQLLAVPVDQEERVVDADRQAQHQGQDGGDRLHVEQR